MIEKILSSPLSITIFVVSIMVGWTIGDMIKEYYERSKSKEVENDFNRKLNT